jgi:arylsulfatase
MGLKEYRPGSTFSGLIARTVDESSPAWPEPCRAPADAANVLFIVLDDTGFGQLGCFGGLSETPNIDRLAANGLRYSNMYTAGLCSPSRSCILTGRNHHSNHMAAITEITTGYPGYDGYIPRANGLLSEILRQQGYGTFAVGKWHLTPSEQLSGAGPFGRWPLGRGFDHFYGFHGGDTQQYYPDLICDNHPEQPYKSPEKGYHLTEDLVGMAIQFVGDAKVAAPDKPFFLYLATGALHAPHQVPADWVRRYRGKFDMGWDQARGMIFERQKSLGVVPENTVLSPRDADVAEWETLRPNEKRVFARMMEVFAGFLAHTDYHLGRLFDFLERIGELDNTLLMLVSDGGASAAGGSHGSLNENKFANYVPESLDDTLAALEELGGPKHFNHYPRGWAWAGNTPFRRWKRETYRGGVSNPLIVHWPRVIRSSGEVRTQFIHAIDMVPTVLECLGIQRPSHIRGVSQSPIEGTSFAYSFADANAECLHRTQYFELLGHRALHHDDWRAVCPWPGPSWKEAGRPFGSQLSKADLAVADSQGWELYNVRVDPAETQNVAAEHRERLLEMIALWYIEAGKYNVLPIDGRAHSRLAEGRPQISRERRQYVFYPRLQGVPERVGPKVLNRPHAIVADVEIPRGGAEGVLFCHGSMIGGYSLFVQGRRLHYAYNYVGAREFMVSSRDLIPDGSLELRLEFELTGSPDLRRGKGAPGRAQLYFEDRLVGQGDIPLTMPFTIGAGSLLFCGQASASPISKAYQGFFPFTGTIRQVTVDLSGELIRDDEATMRAVLARQ